LANQRSLVDAVEVTESQIHIIRLKGIFDASTVGEFEKVVGYLIARNFFNIVVDLGQVEFISSAGWGAFTAELRRVRESAGDIKLSAMSKDLFDVFLLLELDSFIKAFDTAEEAIMAFLAPVPDLEPVVESPAEVVEPFMTEAPMAPVEDTVETKLPVIFDAPASGLIPSRREYAVEYRRPGAEPYQEEFAVENETFEVEPEAVEIAQNGSGLADQENYAREDDTLEIDADLPLAASGPEMYELLLASGKLAVDPVIGNRALPPPRALAPPNDFYNHGVSGPAAEQAQHDEFDDDLRERKAFEPIVERYNHVNFGDDGDEHEAADSFSTQNDLELGAAEPELGFYEHDPIADEARHAETQEFTDLFSGEALHFSGHEPIVDEAAHESTEFTAAPAPESETDFFSSTAEPEVDLPGPAALAPPEAEAFSELSLDLESHLQEHQRAFETRNTWADYPPAMENGSSHAPSGHAMENFSQPIFPPEREAADDTLAADDENDQRKYFEPDSEATHNFSAPAFDNGNDDWAAPGFSNDFTGVWPNAVSSANDSAPEHDEEFETQDIRDPWILEEIDTLPEEYEMDEVAAEDDTPIAADEFISGDFEAELEPLTLAPVNENEPSAPWPEAAAPVFAETYAAADFPAAGEEMFAEPMPFEAERGEAHEKISASLAGDMMSDNDEVNPAPTLPAAPSANGKRRSSFDPAGMEDLPKIPMSNDITEMICGIIAAYPHFGPNMICKFLEEHVEPPVYLSRSTVYRYLCEAGLNTREKRYEFAGQEIDFTDAGALEAAPEARFNDSLN
jgi:anti-sigma B factor antagonist